MYPNKCKTQFKASKRSLAKQRGSMLVIAIFVITVMIFLAVTLQDVFNKASQSVAYEVFGTRALSAANSGAEVALQKIFNLGSETALSYSGSNPETATLTLNSAGTKAALLRCSVVVVVEKFNVSEGVHFYNYDHYRIVSTATCESGDFKTVRSVAVEGRNR